MLQTEVKLFSPSSRCSLAGRVLFLGAAIEVDTSSPILDGNFTVTHKNVPGQVEKKWGRTFVLDAHIQGNLEIGFAGDATTDVDGMEEAISNFPNYRGTVAFDWDWDLETEHTTPAKFTLTRCRLCIGHFISRMLSGFIKKIEPVTKPLEKIIGKDSVLRRPVPKLGDFLGGEVNLLKVLEIFAKAEGRS